MLGYSILYDASIEFDAQTFYLRHVGWLVENHTSRVNELVVNDDITEMFMAYQAASSLLI